MWRNLLFFTAVLLFSGSTSVLGGHAHVHGAGKMNVVLEGKALSIEFEIPAMDLVGFEHEAKSQKDKQKIKNAKAQLKKANSVVTLTKKANCSVKKTAIRVASESEEEAHHKGKHGHGEKHGHKKHGKEEHHSEFVAQYNYLCKTPNELSGIKIGLFEKFHSLKKIKAVVVGPNGQKSKSLSKRSSTLKLK